MNPALDQFRVSCEALIGALDRNDLAAINTATNELANAAGRMKAAADWRNNPAIRAGLTDAAATIVAAQERVNFLTDMARRRLDGLAAARGQLAAATYRPTGL